MNIIETINKTAELISADDFTWIIPKLLEYYKDKINKLSRKAYSSTISKNGIGAQVSRESFNEQAKGEITGALNTFLFKTELWKEHRDINPYLLTCLNRLSDRTESDIKAYKFVNRLICPACKYNGKKELLILDGVDYKCNECTRISQESPSRLSLVFSNHSKKGYQCPDCHRFIPLSANTADGIICPYPDCCFYGDINGLEKMRHPAAVYRKYFLCLNSIVPGSLNNKSYEEFVEDKGLVTNADIVLQTNQSFIFEKDLLKNIISEQLDYIVKNCPQSTLIQKTLMCEAYLNILETNTEDMIGYLVHNKVRTDFSIQARIFQKYVELMKNYLPYIINDKLVTSLLDPELKLFNGISKYNAIVRNDHTIGNLTKERYISKKTGKDYGPCYIGSILDVIDRRTGQSIKEYIDSYGFVCIKMKENIIEKTLVEVTHYRILSHYNVGTLVCLQNIRKKIRNRVLIKLKGRK